MRDGMRNRLRDKAIMVIGGATGIGAATVARLSDEGARVCVADVNAADLRAIFADGNALEVDLAVFDRTITALPRPAARGWAGSRIWPEWSPCCCPKTVAGSMARCSTSTVARSCIDNPIG